MRMTAALRWTTAMTALAGILTAGAALAQSAPPAAPKPADAKTADVETLTTIVVTAKGRKQEVFDVPLSITAFDKSTLDREGAADVKRLAQLTPSLSFEAATGRANTGNVAIRGLSANTIRQQQQSVGFFLDNVYIGGAASSLDFMDFDRVEVLRGPQSTQFGRQTYAGAINYVMKSPETDHITAMYRGSFGSNSRGIEDNDSSSVIVRLPVVQDMLWISAFGAMKHMGAMARSGGGTGVRVGREETFTYGSQVLFRPVPDIDFKGMALFTRENDGASLTATLHPQEWAANGIPIINVRAATAAATVPSIPWPNGTLDMAATPNMAGCESTIDSPRVAAANYRYIGRPYECGTIRNRMFLSGSAEKRFENGIALTYRVGHLFEKRWTNQDLYFRAGPDPFFGTAAYAAGAKAALVTQGADSQKTTNTSHELRIASPDQGDLTWKAGVYLFSEKDTGYRLFSVNAVNQSGQSRGTEGIDEVSVFAGLRWQFAPDWAIEVEDRYQNEKYKLAACSTCATVTPSITTTKNAHNPRVTLSVTPTRESLVYALFSQGTKAGRYALAAPFAFVNPERNKNYELGGNIRLFENRLAFQGAWFHMDVQDQQFASVSTTGGIATAFAQNAGASKVDGFELSVFSAPVTGLSLRGGVGYAKQVYKNPVAPDDANLQRIFNGGTFQGKTSIGVPKWTANLAADYKHPLTEDMSGKIGATLTYTGERFGDSANLSILPAITRVNLRAGLEGESWDVQLYVNDIADNNRPAAASVGATNTCLYTAGLPAGSRCLAVGIDRGRELGLSVMKKF